MSGGRAATSSACASTPPGPSRSAPRAARCTASWSTTPTRPTASSTRRTRAATAPSTRPSSSAAASRPPITIIRTLPFPSSMQRAPPTCKRCSSPRSRPATMTTRSPRWRSSPSATPGLSLPPWTAPTSSSGFVIRRPPATTASRCGSTTASSSTSGPRWAPSRTRPGRPGPLSCARPTTMTPRWSTASRGAHRGHAPPARGCSGRRAGRRSATWARPTCTGATTSWGPPTRLTSGRRARARQSRLPWPTRPARGTAWSSPRRVSRPSSPSRPRTCTGTSEAPAATTSRSASRAWTARRASFRTSRPRSPDRTASCTRPPSRAPTTLASSLARAASTRAPFAWSRSPPAATLPSRCPRAWASPSPLRACSPPSPSPSRTGTTTGSRTPRSSRRASSLA
mmetsp:Transcript_32496/g.83014  ORF Transcript_32496/g.83014 Transcript_32496/m.83014 type:complete len:398 (-) Transcript_32496:2673-3866(-)